jgi:spore coat polysaccharide biosynthesis protein SpsF (cytidylyltransferase family)
MSTNTTTSTTSTTSTTNSGREQRGGASAHSVYAIVQARMSSTRLPGKVLKPLGALAESQTAIGRMLHQVSFAATLDAVVLATSTDPSDDPLAEWAASQQQRCFRGNLHDVLDRYYHAAKQLQPKPDDVIVRITGDCPLLDPDVVDAVVERFLAVAPSGCAYCSNINPPTFPDGQDVEVMRFAALEYAWQRAEQASEREHVTPYIRKHLHLFPQVNLESPTPLEHLRWTLDTPEDYEFLRRVVSALEQPNAPIRMNDVLALLAAQTANNNDWSALNAGIKRNEGYKE